MLINTKHIVLFDDAAADFPRIADMVDNDGAVLILKDGKPAYAVVAFDDVQEADRVEGISNDGAAPAGEPKASTSAKAGKDDTGCCRERGKAGKGEGRSEGKGKGHHHHHAHDEWDVGEPWFGSPGFGGGPGFGGHGFGGGPGFGGPGFAPEDLIGMIPEDVIEAGKNLANSLMGIFSGQASVTPPEEPKE